MDKEYSEDFLLGWHRAAQDDYIGNGKRIGFITEKSSEYLEGYNSFWDKREDEIEEAGRTRIQDYDNLKGY